MMLHNLLHNLVHSLLILGIAGILCIIAQRFFPSIKGQKNWRKETPLDLVYWLFGNLVTAFAILFLAVFVLTLISLISPRIAAAIDSTKVQDVTNLNVFLSLLLLDFTAYWIHRIMHKRKLWKFHAIHHSSPEIDWLSSNRFHPLESIAVVVIGFNLCMLAGFNVATISLALAIRGTYGYVVHANVSWNYGPLGYIIASPYFHRWHHTNDKAALDKNFGGVFSFWDFIFGTAYMPKNIQPGNFGGAKNIGTSFWQQLTYPFR